jgi:lysophospholipid acyltransferase (LPLAT)-like uncharacterized protein
VSDQVETTSRPREPAPEGDGRGAAPPLDAKTRWIIRLGGWLIGLLGRTWRMRIYGREALLRRERGDPRVVFTLWHGQMLPILWAHRQPTGVLISEHRDGEIIAQIIRRFGFFGVRGSSSRGGARALLECVQVLRAGADVAITPDGPRGPRHSFAPGALVVAYRAGAPHVSIVSHADRVWRLRSWDGFEIPKPFARVTVVYGAPRAVVGADVREVSERTSEFAAAMQTETERARMLSVSGSTSA